MSVLGHGQQVPCDGLGEVGQWPRCEQCRTVGPGCLVGVVLRGGLFGVLNAGGTGRGIQLHPQHHTAGGLSPVRAQVVWADVDEDGGLEQRVQVVDGVGGLGVHGHHVARDVHRAAQQCGAGLPGGRLDGGCRFAPAREDLQGISVAGLGAGAHHGQQGFTRLPGHREDQGPQAVGRLGQAQQGAQDLGDFVASRFHRPIGLDEQLRDDGGDHWPGGVRGGYGGRLSQIEDGVHGTVGDASPERSYRVEGLALGGGICTGRRPHSGCKR